MTENQARQPQGIPVGGQFAAAPRYESPVTLDAAPARRPELDGWPASLPEPDVAVHYVGNDALTTWITVGGYGELEVYTPGDDVESIEHGVHDLYGTIPDADLDAVIAWGEVTHRKIFAELHAEQKAAVELHKHAVIGRVTGAAAPIASSELRQLQERSRSVAEESARTAELATASLIARGVRDRHADASYIVLATGVNGGADAVVGVAVFDEESNELGCYRTDGEHNPDTDTHGGGGILEHLPGLEPQAARSHWQQFSLPAIPGTAGRRPSSTEHTIDVAKAAAWHPAGDK